MNGRSAVQAFRSTAQNDGISRFQAQGPRIRRDIRAAFINHPDYAKRRAHTTDMKARGLIPFCNHLTHRIGLPRNGAQPLCHGGDAICVQHKTVHHGICQALFTAKVQILGIFGNNMIRRSNHCVGGSQQGFGLGFRRCIGQHRRRCARACTHFVHLLSKIAHTLIPYVAMSSRCTKAARPGYPNISSISLVLRPIRARASSDG